MNFIKNLISNVVGYVIGPFVNLASFKTNTMGENVIFGLGAAARLIFAASYFVAVPAMLLALAKAWLIFGLALMAFTVVAAMMASFAIFGAFLATVVGNKDKVAAEPVAV